MHRRALAALLVAAGCGASDAPMSAQLSIRFQLSKGQSAGLFDCKDVPEVREVRVRVLGADGITPLVGFPKVADCANGRFEDATVPDGAFTVELLAIGALAGDPEGVLFKLRRPLNLPADRAIEVSLAPEVSFLSIAWTFSPGGDLAPCADEVGTVSIFLGTGAAGSGSYAKTDLDCDLGSFAIPTPLLPQSYTVKLEAYGRESGRKLYGVDETRLLERGANPPFGVVFQPLGGRLVFDWQFAAVMGAPVAACDDASVGVSTLLARVTTMTGDEPIEATIPCAAQRPYTLPGARFTQGRMLKLSLEAEGVHRFYAARDLVASGADMNLGLIDLDAVGSASVAVSRAAMSACPGALDAIFVSVTRVGERTVRALVELDPMGGTALISDVPLGEYDVTVAGMRGAMVACTATARETIASRTQRWRPIEL